jgi:FkbM family methyltransferase
VNVGTTKQVRGIESAQAKERWRDSDGADGQKWLRLAVAKGSRATRLIHFPGWERFLRSLFPPEWFQGRRRLELTTDYEADLHIHCDLSSYIEWCIFFMGHYGRPTGQLIESLLDEGDFAVDVGANVGAYTLIMAQSVGSCGRVAAFDANPEVYDRLLQNLTLNNFTERTETYELALSSRCGAQELYLPPVSSPNRGTATLIQQTRPQGAPISVQVETLDRVISNWKRCDLIKADTDGNDFAVLEGASEIIRQHLPSLIFEFDADLWPDAWKKSERLSTWLQTLGYSFHWIDQRWGKVRKVSSASLPKGNILALPANRKLSRR